MASSSSSSPSSSKKNKGRQKVELVRMEKDSNRYVTFSKRRCGLFKKGSELCTLCGAEVAIIVFSPGKKTYTFGHPSLENVLRRFILSSNPPSSESVVEVAQRNACVSDLNIQLNFVNNQVEVVQKCSEEISDMKKAKEQVNWWDKAVEELGFQQIVHLKTALEEMRKAVIRNGNKNVVNHHFPIMRINHPMLGCYDGALMFNPNNINGFIGFGHAYY